MRESFQIQTRVIQEYKKNMVQCICKYLQYVFFCDFGNMRKNNVFCRKFTNTRPTKEFKANFAFPESLPNFATLGIFTDFIFVERLLRYSIFTQMTEMMPPPCKVSKGGIALVNCPTWQSLFIWSLHWLSRLSRLSRFPYPENKEL